MAPMRSPLLLGIDAGGTRTRAVLADVAGEVLGTGESGPANLVGPEHELALQRMSEAAEAARGHIGPERIGAACVGAAGLLALPGGAEPLARELRAALGVEAPVRLISDTVVAFAAGTPEPDGTVALAGTGAVAFAVRGHASTSRADGYGWLLGDAGSGFWLGREAVRATLRHLDGHGPGGWMVQAVLDEIAPSRRISSSVIGQCMADSPVRLARLSPIVCEAADGGDPVAGAIVGRAVDHLADTVGLVADPGLPIVMSGSLLAGDTPVSRGLYERLTGHYPDAPLLVAGDGPRGAAWLAAREVESDPAVLKRLHERLVQAESD